MATMKMRDVTSDDLKTWGAHQAGLRELFDKLSVAADQMINAIIDINAAIEDAQGFVQSIADEAQEAFDERSEHWQQGEAGGDYSSWIEQLTEFVGRLEQIEEFDPPEAPDWLDEDLPPQD